MTDTLWSLPHHDGSTTYVPNPTPKLGGKVTVFLRVPRSSDVTNAWVRVLCDGEPELVHAEVDRQDERDTWLRADLRVTNPVVSYRWLLDGGAYGYQWLNGAGLHSHDVADASDFRLSAYDPPPTWATSTMYQIFPDHFAKSVNRPAPAWAKPADRRRLAYLLARITGGDRARPRRPRDSSLCAASCLGARFPSSRTRRFTRSSSGSR